MRRPFLTDNGSRWDQDIDRQILYFGFGSSTDLTTPKFDFRSSPESELKSDVGPCPKGANSGHQPILTSA